MQTTIESRREIATAAGVATAERWLKASEAARRARCGVKRIFWAAKAGRLRAIRVDARGALRFSVEAVDAWVSEGARIDRGGARQANRNP